MSYTTVTFAGFFTIVLFLRYRLPDRAQMPMLLLANYSFYLWAKPAYGFLLFWDTLLAYGIGHLMRRQKDRAKLWLIVGVGTLFAILFTLKYLDFFCQSVLDLLGVKLTLSLQILLPVGISFYTFSLAGYLWDIYRGKMEPESNVLQFAVYASFFPSIMAGPINQARDFLPQLEMPVVWRPEQVKGGLLRFLWGMGKKLIVADQLGLLVNGIYAAPGAYSGRMLLLTSVVYSFQIYFDFAAYSDMALGAASMLGFALMENFKAPYFSRNIQTFWKKWHISLTSWFREYLYIPLGGSREGKGKTYRNILLVFTISGLWHGAAVTFLVWGLLNGLYQVVGKLSYPVRQRFYRILHLNPDGRGAIYWQTFVTFLLVTVTWIFFRADSLSEAFCILGRILTGAEGKGAFHVMEFLSKRQICLLLIAFLPLVLADGFEAAGRSVFTCKMRPLVYWSLIIVLVLSILVFGAYGPGFHAQDFVYFQF